MKTPIPLFAFLGLAASYFVNSVLGSPENFEWKDLSGNSLTGRFSGLISGNVYLWSDEITWTSIAFQSLDKTSQDHALAEYAASVESPLWKDSQSPMAEITYGKMSEVRDGKIKEYDPEDRVEPAFYAVYYSASWCGPCRQFSPTLKSIYEELKDNGLDNFELFYASSDTSNGKMKAFAIESQMPWKLLEFKAVTKNPILSRVKGSGIPSLVIFNREGHVISHSYKGEEYLGPLVALKDLMEFVYSTNIRNLYARKELFNLRFKNFMESIQNTDEKKIQTCLIFPDELTILNLPPEKYKLTGLVTEKGRFQLDKVFPEIDSDKFEEMKEITSNWYFYPQIISGYSVDSKISIPITLK